MSTIVTMTSTVGELLSGQTYRVRSRTAEKLVSNTQATKSTLKKSSSAKEGKG